jgi:hypothetical protein
MMYGKKTSVKMMSKAGKMEKPMAKAAAKKVMAKKMSKKK